MSKFKKYKDVLRILKRRIEFFRGELYEAGGKELMYRVMASEPELKMLEYIETQYEPTSYERKQGYHVEYITPEICLFVRLIYEKLKEKNARAEPKVGSEAGSDSASPGGGEPARKRLKRGDAAGDGASEAQGGSGAGHGSVHKEEND